MHKWKSYDVWFRIYGVWLTELFFTLDHFLPLYSPNNRENHNFDKMKKTTWDIILYMCTINENHMMYVSWDMKHDRQTIKLKFRKNEIKTWRYHLNKSTKNYDHGLYRSWDMVHDVCNFHFLFWAAFCPFKAPGDITILPMHIKN